MEIASSLAPARQTEVYDTYWRFAAERQAIEALIGEADGQLASVLNQ